MTGMWPAIVAIVTLIVGPLLAMWIKSYYAGKAAKDAAAAAETADEHKAQQNQQNQAQGAGDINQSIDTQKKAGDTPIQP